MCVCVYVCVCVCINGKSASSAPDAKRGGLAAVEIRPSVRPSVHPSVCPSVCLSIYPSIHPSIQVDKIHPIYPSIYRSIDRSFIFLSNYWDRYLLPGAVEHGDAREGHTMGANIAMNCRYFILIFTWATVKPAKDRPGVGRTSR